MVAGQTRKLQSGAVSSASFLCPENIPGCASCDTAGGSSIVYFCNKCATGFYLTFDKRFCYCPPGTFWNGAPAPEEARCLACNAPPFQVGPAIDNSAWCPGGSKSATSVATALPGRTPCGEGLYTSIVKASKTTACVLKPGWFLSQQNPDLASPCAGSTHNKGGNRVIACAGCKSGLIIAPDQPGLPPQLRAAKRRSEQSCQVPAGRYWVRGAAKPCDKGYWREGVLPRSWPDALACKKCPAGLLTEATGASTFDMCNVIPAGFELQGTLQPCPYGTFGLQRTINLTAPDQAWACKPCPYGYTTKQQGATSDEPCKAPPGYYVAGVADSFDQATGMYNEYRLAKCPFGYFRDGWAKTHTSGFKPGSTVCSSCGENLGTQDTVPDEHPNAQPNSLVSTSADNCYVAEGWGAILDLSAGGARLKAYPCALGTYGQATKTFGLSPVSCTACTPGLMTEGWASIGEDSCKHGPGVGYSNGAFTRCPISSYNPPTSKEACVECPHGRTTQDGANLQADPTDCFPQPGWGVSKAEANAAIMQISNTTAGASTNADTDDIDDARAAALAALSVAECKEGAFSKLGDFKVDDAGLNAKLTRLTQYCSDCPAGSTTWDSASESVQDCNVCLPGHQKTSGSCTPCPVGSYQSERDEDAVCMLCPDSALSFASKETFIAQGLTPVEGAITEALCYPSVFPIESLDGSFDSGPPPPPPPPPGEDLWSAFTSSSPAADFAACRATCPADSCCLLSHAYDDMGDSGTGGTCTRASFHKLSQTTDEGIPLVSLHLKVPAAGTVSAAAAAAAPKTKAAAAAAAALAATQQPFEVLNVGLAPGNSSQILLKIKDAADGTVQTLTAEEVAKKYPGQQADEAEVKAQSAEFNGVYARCTVKAEPTDSDYMRPLGDTNMFKLYASLGLVMGGMAWPVQNGNPDHRAEYLKAQSKCDVYCNQTPQCIGYLHLAVVDTNNLVDLNACNLIRNFLFTGSPVLGVNERGAVVVP